MASSFASQLRQIAAHSTHELDLKAQRAAHAESLLFSSDVAAKQDFNTIFAICFESFRELCLLDDRFRDYERSLFSPHAKDQDRQQMNRSENEALDTALERCMGLLGNRLLLQPGIRAMEWLVRRFQVHIHNVRSFLFTFLPYHEMQLWKNAISIVPQERVVGEWKFARPYLQTTWTVPRHALVNAASTNDAFFSSFNAYVLNEYRHGVENTSLLQFWVSIMVEALSNRFDQARSGRKEVQDQKMNDVLLRILPVLSEGLENINSEALILSCQTLAMVIAAKAVLHDQVLDSLLVTVAESITKNDADLHTTLLTLSVLAGRKENRNLPKSVLRILMKIDENNWQSIVLRTRDPQALHCLFEAIITSTIERLKQTNTAKYLPFVELILRTQIMHPQTSMTTKSLRPVLRKIIRLNNNGEPTSTLASALVELLRKLNDEQSFQLVISDAVREEDLEAELMEGLMGSVLLPPTVSVEGKMDAIEDEEKENSDPDLDFLSTKIPTRTTNTNSFLSEVQNRLYDQLCEAFQVGCKAENFVEAWNSLQLWSTSDSDGKLALSFLLRFMLEQSSTQARVAALRVFSGFVQHQQVSYIQHSLPYVLMTLADSSLEVRRAAATALFTLASSMGDLHETTSADISELYANTSTEAVKTMSASQVQQVVDRALSPMLEECILDPERLPRVIAAVLSGTGTSDLKKAVRQAFFDTLVYHALSVPLLRARLGILGLLKDVQKVGSENKSRALSPLLEEWSNLDETTAIAAAEREKLNTQEIDTALVELIDERSMEVMTYITNLQSDGEGTTSRLDLLNALFSRPRAGWKHQMEGQQQNNAAKLFELAFSGSEAVSHGASSTLRSVSLSSDALASFLAVSIDQVTDLRNDPPPKKRRRTSHSESSRVSKVTEANISKLTFALELVEGSMPESKPELLPSLFDALAALKLMRQQRQIESPYLLNLCLGSVLTIVERVGTGGVTTSLAGVRLELVTECVRDCDNPQVLNTALLLAASLSNFIPDRMVHDIMPIFTFVSHGMFANQDENSIQVMDRAIDEIVPALVTSLRKRRQTQNLLQSVSKLLTSFVSAFDHIPHHRRVTFYQRIFTQVGAEDFGFIIVALLAVRKGNNPDFLRFVNNLLDKFPVELQMKTYRQLILLVGDIFGAQPKAAEAILGVNQSTASQEKRHTAELLLHVAQQILLSKDLKSQIARMHKIDASYAQQLTDEIENVFQTTLASIRSHQNDPVVLSATKGCLHALLDLLSLTEIFAILPRVLDSLEPDLQPQSLRIVTHKLGTNAPKDGRTREAAMGLLSKLGELLGPTADASMRQAIMACMDKITETYGRKDPDSIVAAANSIVQKVLPAIVPPKTTENYNDATTAILTLATVVETIKEATVPLVPDTLPWLQQIIKTCTAAGDRKALLLFNASGTLITAILSHVPFMISEDQLANILRVTLGAAAIFNDTQIHAMQKDLSRTIARKVDFDAVIRALTDSQNRSILAEPTKVVDAVELLSLTVESASKSTVVRHAEPFSDLFLSYLRARESLASAETPGTGDAEVSISDIESALKETSIKFIYKLNDAAFRPVFESWVDWGSSPMDIEEGDVTKTLLRQTALFSILIHLFQTLKAIITSYTSHLLKPISAILTEIASLATESSTVINTSLTSARLTLFSSTLSLLRTTALHDADGFYTAPSHFESVGVILVKCIELASHKSLRQLVYSQVIPTIVSLASATIDAPPHHHTLSHHITQLRHHGSAHVRLASIRTLHALIDDEESATFLSAADEDAANVVVGDDWIANTIGVGSGEGEGARGAGSSAGEVMIYVNEMLEDDDEEVEREVRRWVHRVRERVGEDVFEM